MKTHAGFTLLELFVVVVVMIILLSIAFFMGQQ
ncbi:prepilin-type N-terminal cleavage/methylation domain-containing protein [Candidatus Saccharibacteria bacterium]|nr:prepilin-type N-terminal cleavage/methylation domain-containing protein [Candidatus Saccharibacteria bacterium]